MTDIARQYETLVLERDGAVATLRIDREERMNSLWTQVYHDFAAAFDAIEADASVRAVVITGTGERAFCAGGDARLDLEQVARAGPREMVAESRLAQSLVRRIRELPLPVVARVNGVAVGGGFDLAIACDLVVASTEASFAALWVKRGLAPVMGGGHQLPRLVGTHRAKELIFTGDRIDATEAERIGLINRAVSPERLDTEVGELAQRLAALPTVAIGVAKQLVNRAAERDIETDFAVSALATYVLGQTEDHREGVASFVEKRAPRYVGR